MYIFALTRSSNRIDHFILENFFERLPFVKTDFQSYRHVNWKLLHLYFTDWELPSEWNIILYNFHLVFGSFNYVGTANRLFSHIITPLCLVYLVCLCTQFISVFLPNKYLFPRHIFFFFLILTNIFMERTTRKEMEYIFSRFACLFQDSYPRLLYRFHAPFSNFVTFVREYRYYRIFVILPSCMYVCGNFVTRTRYSTPRR